MKDWEKNMPIGVVNILNEHAKEPTRKCFKALGEKDLEVVTPMSEVRRLLEVTLGGIRFLLG